MGLREQAEKDLGFILESDEAGFRWPITLTNPDETPLEMHGFSDDIAQLIDPETGAVVSGRLASVALRMSTILTAGFILPKAIADTTGKPWLVTFDSINGVEYTFKVAQSNPDRALGLITLMLEAYTK